MNAIVCASQDQAAIVQALLDDALAYPSPGIQQGGTVGRLVRVDAQTPGPGWTLHAVPVVMALDGSGRAAILLDDAASDAWSSIVTASAVDADGAPASELRPFVASLPAPAPLPDAFVPTPPSHENERTALRAPGPAAPRALAVSATATKQDVQALAEKNDSRFDRVGVEIAALSLYHEDHPARLALLSSQLVALSSRVDHVERESRAANAVQRTRLRFLAGVALVVAMVEPIVLHLLHS